jgi:dCMP deaminase
MEISNMDRQFMELSCEARRYSHDPHRRVGAVIVDQEGVVIATGANSPPSALNISAAASLKAISEDPSWKYFMLEHAERNAIHDAYKHCLSIVGTTMYVTLFPCSDCARAIVAAGIARVVVPLGYGETERDDKWAKHYHYSSIIFKSAGVQLDTISFHIP